MGILAERLDAMTISISTQDGLIEGVYRPHGDGARIRFRGNGYHHYNERGLEHQLSGLVSTWWTEYERRYDDALAEALGRPVEKKEHWDVTQRRYLAEQAETVFSGMSAHEYIYFQNTGLRDWMVVIRDGALAALDEFEFAAEVASGHAAMMADFLSTKSKLIAKHRGR